MATVQACGQHIVHAGVAAGVVVQIVWVNVVGFVQSVFNGHRWLSIKITFDVAMYL
jgi:ribosomal protein S19